MLLLVIAVVCFIMWCAGIAGNDHDVVQHLTGSTAATNSGTIAKNFGDGKSRLLFVAGLEGTGHHAWQDMFQECIDANHCEVHVNLTHSLMQFDPVKLTVHGLFGAEDTHMNAAQIDTVFHIMKSLAVGTGDRLYLVGLCFVKRSAMLSYPNYNGINKALDHPDISTLAALAELAGLDFRVLVLQRSAQEILASTRRRDIGGVDEPKVLVDNAAALYTQMKLIDRAFYHCVHYRELGKMTQNSKAKAQLMHFLHPVLMPAVMDAMLSKVQYAATNTSTSTTYTPARTKKHGLKASNTVAERTQENLQLEMRSNVYHEWQLQQRMDLIDELCRSEA